MTFTATLKPRIIDTEWIKRFGVTPSVAPGEDIMTVYLVILQRDQGKIAGVFSTQEKVAEYITNKPYNGYTIIEAIVDEPRL